MRSVRIIGAGRRANSRCGYRPRAERQPVRRGWSGPSQPRSPCIRLCGTLGGQGRHRRFRELDWSSSRSIYQWEGIRVEGDPRRVTRVTIQRRELTGLIPAEIGRLDGLVEFWAYDNELTGPLPNRVGEPLRSPDAHAQRQCANRTVAGVSEQSELGPPVAQGKPVHGLRPCQPWQHAG